MTNPIIESIEQSMLPHLNNEQLEVLHLVLTKWLTSDDSKIDDEPSIDYLTQFLAAKRVEGCSSKTLRFYELTLDKALQVIKKPVKRITTEDIRTYLDNYAAWNGAGKVTIDNVRRILSSFFTWLENEDYLMKSPMKRIHKVRTGQSVKDTYTDEVLEMMRDNCHSLRDLAIIDLLSSSGMRVGELVHLNRDDVNFEQRECIVFGKGSKERRVYFDARTKLHLRNYLDSRTDAQPALFVSLNSPTRRLQIPGVEIMLRKLGQELNLNRVHPHKFRRTMATRAIGKGMPIEQVQHLLGHRSVDTTLRYAMVNQNNVKISHDRYLC